MSVKDRKFYWLKLKTEFMTGDTIDFLMSQKNGANYVVLYQMLCVKTINTKGELATKIGDILIPFDIDKIQRECKWFDRDTVMVAMELYKKLGLLYEQENGIIKIVDFETIVGSETYWAKQKRIERATQNDENIEVGQECGQALDSVQNSLLSKSISYSNDNIQEEKNIDDDNIQCLSKLLRLYPQIQSDLTNLAFVDEPNYSLILEMFEKSEYLRTKCVQLSWIVKNHIKIESGFYTDKPKTKSVTEEDCPWEQDETGAWRPKK